MGKSYQTMDQTERVDRVKEMRWRIEALKGDDMRSIAYARANNDKAQEAIDMIEKILNPMTLHAKDMSKQLTERMDELHGLELVLPILEDKLEEEGICV